MNHTKLLPEGSLGVCFTPRRQVGSPCSRTLSYLPCCLTTSFQRTPSRLVIRSPVPPEVSWGWTFYPDWIVCLLSPRPRWVLLTLSEPSTGGHPTSLPSSLSKLCGWTWLRYEQFLYGEEDDKPSRLFKAIGFYFQFLIQQVHSLR